MTDARVVPARAGRGEVREKASRFLAFAKPLEHLEQAATELEALRREYHDAAHIAYAWKLGGGPQVRRRCADAGEPSGTAGRPIASAIDSAGVTDVLVAVVRYFGGTKLGTGGLARAYREAAARALEAAGRRSVPETIRVEIACAYETIGNVRRLIRPPEVSLLEERFGEDCTFSVAVVRSAAPALLAKLEQAQMKYRID